MIPASRIPAVTQIATRMRVGMGWGSEVADSVGTELVDEAAADRNDYGRS